MAKKLQGSPYLRIQTQQKSPYLKRELLLPLRKMVKLALHLCNQMGCAKHTCLEQREFLP
jgi:hypothetical protein